MARKMQGETKQKILEARVSGISSKSALQFELQQISPVLSSLLSTNPISIEESTFCMLIRTCRSFGGFFPTFIYSFGCTGSWGQHPGSFSLGMQTLSCGMWDLIPWPGIEPGPLRALGVWERGILATGSTGQSHHSLMFKFWNFL